MFKNIMVAVDSSQNAQKAYHEAIFIAKTNQARLTALSVIQLPEYAATVGEVEEVKREGQRFFSRILADVVEVAQRENLQVDAKILIGHPADVIIRFAAEGNYDLIVMGHQGASGIKNFLMGSVSSKVLQHSKCSVLIIK